LPKLNIHSLEIVKAQPPVEQPFSVPNHFHIIIEI